MSEDPRCPTCHHRFVPTDPDEAEVLSLPPSMCKCAVARHIARLQSEGWVPSSRESASLRAKLGIPCRHDVAEYIIPRVGRGAAKLSSLGFGPYIPEWASYLLLLNERVVHFLGPAAAKIKQDPALAATVATIGRTGGVLAVQDFLFAGLHPRNLDHDPRDLPDEVLDGKDIAARVWGRAGS